MSPDEAPARTPFLAIATGYLAASLVAGALVAGPGLMFDPSRGDNAVVWLVRDAGVAVLVTAAGAALLTLVPFVVVRAVLGLAPARRGWLFALGGIAVAEAPMAMIASTSSEWAMILGFGAFAGITCGLTAFAVENLCRRKWQTA